jgi:hypothetical protein
MFVHVVVEIFHRYIGGTILTPRSWMLRVIEHGIKMKISAILILCFEIGHCNSVILSFLLSERLTTWNHANISFEISKAKNKNRMETILIQIDISTSQWLRHYQFNSDCDTYGYKSMTGYM